MIIKLNVDLQKYKKGALIDLDRVPYKDKQYFLRRLKDSKIDNCVEEVKEEIKKNKKAKKSLEEATDLGG